LYNNMKNSFKVMLMSLMFYKILFWTYFLPTITRTASCMSSRARSSTKSGKVALNRERIIEGFVHALIIESICVNNPGSNSLSDSSRTRYSTLQ
jgi:low temperature requirement protein LtrA